MLANHGLARALDFYESAGARKPLDQAPRRSQKPTGVKPPEPARKPSESAKMPAAPARKPSESAKMPAELARKPSESAKMPAEPARKPSLDPQKRIAELEAALQAARSGVEETLKSLQMRVEHTREEKGVFERSSNQRAKERDEARKERDDFKRRLETAEAKLAETQRSQKLPPPTKQMPESAVRELAQAREAAAKEAAEAREVAKELAEARSKIAALEKALEAPRSAPADAKELADARARIAALEEDLDSARSAPVVSDEIMEARSKIASLEEALATVQSAPGDLAMARTKIDDLERALELATMRDAAPGAEGAVEERVHDLELALADAREQNAPLREDLARARERIKNLEKEAKAERKSARLAVPQEKPRETIPDEEKLHARIAELERQLELSQREAAPAGDRTVTTPQEGAPREDTQELEEALMRAEAKLAEIEKGGSDAALVELVEARDAAQLEAKHLEMELAGARERIAELEADADSSRTRATEAEESLATRDADLTIAHEKIAALEGAAPAAAEAPADADPAAPPDERSDDERLAALEAELAQARAEIEDAHARRERLRAVLAGANTSETWVDDIEGHVERLAQSGARIEELVTQVGLQSQQVEEVREQAAQAELALAAGEAYAADMAALATARVTELIVAKAEIEKLRLEVSGGPRASENRAAEIEALVAEVLSRAMTALQPRKDTATTKKVAGRLTVVEGPGAGELLVIGGGARVTIGRAQDATHTLQDTTLSRKHCAIEASGGKLWLRDLHSSEGTFLNGAAIEKRTELALGDKIQVGASVLEVNELHLATPSDAAKDNMVPMTESSAERAAATEEQLNMPLASVAPPPASVAPCDACQKPVIVESLNDFQGSRFCEDCYAKLT